MYVRNRKYTLADYLKLPSQDLSGETGKSPPPKTKKTHILWMANN
jgi:hypothetical protein